MGFWYSLIIKNLAYCLLSLKLWLIINYKDNDYSLKLLIILIKSYYFTIGLSFGLCLKLII